MHNTTGGDRPQIPTPRAGIRTAHFWAALYAGLVVLWTGVTVVRLLQDPHPDLRGGLFRARR